MENHTQGVTVCVRIRTSGLAFFRLKLKVTVVTASKKVLACDVIVMSDFVVLMREFKVAVCTFRGGFMLTDLIW